MINLLPPEAKLDIQYARRNTMLVRWIAAGVLFTVLVVGLLGFGQYYISKNTQVTLASIEVTNQRLASQNMLNAQKELETISKNLKTVLQIAGKQLLFSKLITRIGGILPAQTRLNGMTLSTSNSALDLNIAARDRNAATQAVVNISDPKNGLFSKADLVSVTCNDTATDGYPCQAQVRVIMKTDSSYYFLNSVTGKQS